MAARAEFFLVYRIPEISAAAQRWAFVAKAAAKAAAKARDEDENSRWIEYLAAKARRCVEATQKVLRRAEAAELEWADQAAAWALDAYACGERGTLGLLGCPPLPDAATVAAGEGPPSWLLLYFTPRGHDRKDPAKPYHFPGRPGLCGSRRMTEHAFSCMFPMDLDPGVDVMRMAVQLKTAWGSVTLGNVSTAEYAYSGVAAGLVALASGARPPLPAPVLAALLREDVVAAASAMPRLQNRASTALRYAIFNSCRTLFAIACRCMEDRRERDLLAERRVELLDEVAHLRTLVEASHAATCAALDAEQRALEAPPERHFSLVAKQQGSANWIATVRGDMGVGRLCCAAPTAALAARLVDLMRKMLSRNAPWSSPWNFPERDYEQVMPLLPPVPWELKRRGLGTDTPALAILREDFLRPLLQAAAFASVSDGGELPLSPAEYAALLAHIRRLSRDLAAATDDATTGAVALSELDAWVQGGGGWRGGHAPALVREPGDGGATATAASTRRRPRGRGAAGARDYAWWH